jgi:hypothetical protein
MATDRTIVKGVAPDMARAAFVAELARVKSPATPAAGAVYDEAARRGLSPSFLLGMFWEESRYGTDPDAICVGGGGAPEPTHSWGNTTQDAQKPSYGHPGTGRVVRGRFSVYPDWHAGGISTVARLFEHPPYRGRDTVRAIIEIWAPPEDNNRTEDYIAGVAATMTRLAQPPGGHVPEPPINARPVVPPKSSGRGYDLSATPRKPLGTCTHSMVGTLWGTDGHFRLPNTAGLTDFGIGQKDTGRGYAEIIRWCDPFGKVIPWANGEATGIEGDGRRFVDTHGVGQINRGLVSIETEDGATPTDAQGRPTAPATAAQWSSLVWLTAFVHAEWCGQTAATLDWHLLHKEFATKDCPFPRIYNHLDALRAAVRAVMRHWQEGAAYPAGGVIIDGRRLAVPTRPVAASESPFIRALRALWAA